MPTDVTKSQHSGLIPYLPGQSGNPAGRPKGSRSKLQEDFLSDVLAAWKLKGAAAIDAMIEDKPGDFVKMVAGILPKEATLNINDASDMSEDELVERIRHLTTTAATFLLGGGTAAADDGAGGETIEAVATRVH